MRVGNGIGQSTERPNRAYSLYFHQLAPHYISWENAGSKKIQVDTSGPGEAEFQAAPACTQLSSLSRFEKMSVLRAQIVIMIGVHEEAKSVVNCDEQLDGTNNLK